MIVVALVCVTMGSVSVLRFRIISRLRAMETIEALGGSITYDFQDKAMDSPSELAIAVGRAFGDTRAFAEVRCVTFYGKAGQNFADSELSLLRHFPRLRRLDLQNTRITDKGLGQLAEYQELEHLVLTGGRPLTIKSIDQLKPMLGRIKWITIEASSGAEVCEKVTSLLRPEGELSVCVGNYTTDYTDPARLNELLNSRAPASNPPKP